MLKREQFLPAITSTDKQGPGWRETIKEIDELGLKKAALFPTCLEKADRKKMYRLLEKTHLEKIPFVHIRGDMSPDELDYLIEKYKTKLFNIHSKKEHPVLYDYSKYQSMLYIEDAWRDQIPENLKNFAGICLDTSHLENDKRLHKDRYRKGLKILEQYPIGCNHISAVREMAYTDDDGRLVSHSHYFEDLSQFNYLKNYPKEYFSNFIAIELENSLKEQLKVIDYILSL